jgi:hypothetical protein
MSSPNPECCTARRIRLMCRAVTPGSLPPGRGISPLIAFSITCCFVITLASRATRRSIVSIRAPVAHSRADIFKCL